MTVTIRWRTLMLPALWGLLPWATSASMAPPFSDAPATGATEVAVPFRGIPSIAPPTLTKGHERIAEGALNLVSALQELGTKQSARQQLAAIEPEITQWAAQNPGKDLFVEVDVFSRQLGVATQKVVNGIYIIGSDASAGEAYANHFEKGFFRPLPTGGIGRQTAGWRKDSSASWVIVYQSIDGLAVPTGTIPLHRAERSASKVLEKRDLARKEANRIRAERAKKRAAKKLAAKMAAKRKVVRSASAGESSLITRGCTSCDLKEIRQTETNKKDPPVKDPTDFDPGFGDVRLTIH